MKETKDLLDGTEKSIKALPGGESEGNVSNNAIPGNASSSQASIRETTVDEADPYQEPAAENILPEGAHSIAHKTSPSSSNSLDSMEPFKHKKKKSIRGRHKHHKSSSSLDDDLDN